MVAHAFPIAKLAMMAIKQVSKPIGSFFKNRAKSSLFFRTHICMPPAQLYHWMEVQVKMRMLNLGKPAEVPKLNEAMAIELGAELLGEAIVFFVGCACVTAEYMRQAAVTTAKAEEQEKRRVDMENRLYELEYIVTEQEARLRQMARGKHPEFRFPWRTPRLPSDHSPHTPIIGKRIPPEALRPRPLYPSAPSREPVQRPPGQGTVQFEKKPPPEEPPPPPPPPSDDSAPPPPSTDSSEPVSTNDTSEGAGDETDSSEMESFVEKAIRSLEPNFRIL